MPKQITVFVNRRFVAHIFLLLDSISYILPFFWVHCRNFEYKNFSGKFCRAKILIVEVIDSNQSICFKQTEQSY